MNLDPHTLQQILQRIYQQMRCPQCGRHVSVDFSSVRVVADNAMLLQLQCEDCDAYIVLQASLNGLEAELGEPYIVDETANKSTTLSIGKDDLSLLRKSLKGAEGSGVSFDKLFKDSDKEKDESDIRK